MLGISTAPDHTMYPFLTTDPSDYSNLLRVYLDAVLRPKLDESDFKQEGHRFEFEKADGLFFLLHS
jgi:Zn-dependent M16 (insulinase) family peptidase